LLFGALAAIVSMPGGRHSECDFVVRASTSANSWQPRAALAAFAEATGQTFLGFAKPFVYPPDLDLESGAR
jgi:hypothetical protein